jgi:hypothetical protein
MIGTLHSSDGAGHLPPASDAKAISSVTSSLLSPPPSPSTASPHLSSSPSAPSSVSPIAASGSGALSPSDSDQVNVSPAYSSSPVSPLHQSAMPDKRKDRPHEPHIKKGSGRVLAKESSAKSVEKEKDVTESDGKIVGDDKRTSKLEQKGTDAITIQRDKVLSLRTNASSDSTRRMELPMGKEAPLKASPRFASTVSLTAHKFCCFCEEASSKWSCITCAEIGSASSYCDDCVTIAHSRGKRKDHIRVMYTEIGKSLTRKPAPSYSAVGKSDANHDTPRTQKRLMRVDAKMALLSKRSPNANDVTKKITRNEIADEEFVAPNSLSQSVVRKTSDTELKPKKEEEEEGGVMYGRMDENDEVKCDDNDDGGVMYGRPVDDHEIEEEKSADPEAAVMYGRPVEESDEEVDEDSSSGSEKEGVMYGRLDDDENVEEHHADGTEGDGVMYGRLEDSEEKAGDDSVMYGRPLEDEDKAADDPGVMYGRLEDEDDDKGGAVDDSGVMYGRLEDSIDKGDSDSSNNPVMYGRPDEDEPEKGGEEPVMYGRHDGSSDEEDDSAAEDEEEGAMYKVASSQCDDGDSDDNNYEVSINIDGDLQLGDMMTSDTPRAEEEEEFGTGAMDEVILNPFDCAQSTRI